MTRITDATGPLLPDGACLVHIGPPKTGTTALQEAFHAARRDLIAQNVVYAGRMRHSRRAIFAAMKRPAFRFRGEPPPTRLWGRLVADVNAARGSRVMLSSEGLSDATPEAIRRIVDDLDPGRVHVVATLRPLTRILASQWQQSVKGGLRMPFDAWLRKELAEPDTSSSFFWRRHRDDRLVARWADVVGPERLTVVVVDEKDHGVVLRAFERLLGIREGTLVAVRNRTNRSMTLAEVEAVRAFNEAFVKEGLGWELHHRVAPFHPYMSGRVPSPDEPRIETPQWALDRATEIAREMVAAIAVNGVRVIGDLESLAAPQVSGLAGDAIPDVPIPPEIAALMAMRVLMRTELPRQAIAEPGRSVEPADLSRVPSRDLAAILAQRSRAAAVRRFRLGRRRST